MPIARPSRRALAGAVLLACVGGGVGPRLAAEPAAAAPGGGLWGAVLEGGKAVAGAQVLLYRGVPYPSSMADFDERRRQLGLLERTAQSAAPVARTTSDASGTFVFDALEPGNYAVEARGPGGGAAISPGIRVELARLASFGLELAAPTPFQGRVLDAGGSPYQGLVLLGAAYRGYGDEPDLPHVVVRQARTDAAGAFRLDAVPPGDWRLLAGEPGVAWSVLGPVPVRPGEAGRPAPPVELRLPPRVALDRTHVPARPAAPAVAGRVTGRVLGPDGLPREGVAVCVMDGGDGFLVPNSGPVVTGADGSFVVTDVEPGPAWVQVLGGGVASRRLSGAGEPPSGAELFQVPAGGEATVVVRAAAAVALAGRVVDEQGAPVAGALVHWESADVELVRHGIEDAPPPEQTIRSDAQGRFRIPTLVAHVPCTLRASAPGFLPAMTSIAARAAGTGGEVTVRLSPARWVTLRVRRGAAGAEEASPAAGASVHLPPYGDREGMEIPDEPTRTDPEGRVVAGPLPRRAIRVEVFDPETARRTPVAIPAEAAGPVEVRLKPRPPDREPASVAPTRTTSVRVRVLGHDGGAVAQASLDYGWPGQMGTRWVTGDTPCDLEFLGEDPPAGLELQVTNATDAEGRTLPYGPAHVGPLAAGVSEVEIRLPPGRPIAGRLVAPTGTSAAGVEVLARALTGRPYEQRPVLGRATTGADGSFVIPSGGEQPVEVELAPDESQGTFALAQPVRLTPGARAVDIPLLARIDVVLTVLTAEGAPADGAFVRANLPGSPAREQRRVRATESGEARLPALVPGARYVLRIEPPPELGASIVLSGWTPASGEHRLRPRR